MSNDIKQADTFIGSNPPSDGRRWDCQCARCGSSLFFETCNSCGGDGITEPGELYEEDPNYYQPNDICSCRQCGGEASWPICGSTPEWCEKNPIEGREETKRSTPEWFVIQG